jgi:UDP-N-acetylmuramyl pentapeptide phosphotransferase/UDP-N-acetylglucosamine-1-phosphate transferase
MIIYFLIFIISFLWLLFLNTLFKKYNFCLDKVSKNEKHKSLLQLDYKVPISGTFYLLPIIIFLNYLYNLNLIFICFCLFVIGIFSDLKISNSPKLRLTLQFISVLFFLYFKEDLNIDVRVSYFNFLLENEIYRTIIISFFFLVLINGYNFIDGVNSLCSLNFIIILFFFFLIAKNHNFVEFEKLFLFLILTLSIFVGFNFFGKNFLGDGGVYGFSCFLGITAIYLSNKTDQVSPYFIANLFWYSAFENLFSIIRRLLYQKKNYLADNLHLHHLIFIYLSKKKIFKKKYLLSSFTGIIINIYLLSFYIIGFLDYSDTKLQIYLILINSFLYIFSYFNLKKLND